MVGSGRQAVPVSRVGQLIDIHADFLLIAEIQAEALGYQNHARPGKRADLYLHLGLTGLGGQPGFVAIGQAQGLGVIGVDG